MIGRRHHLREECLLDCYVAQKSGEPLNPPLAAHLSSCGECGARYAELSRFMEDLRTEAEVETDAIFTPETLRLQQHQIARRLEHLGHPARIISFPARLVRRHLTATASRIAPRWAAGAAAAGLFIGVAAGVLYDSSGRPAPTSLTVSQPARVTLPLVATTTPAPLVDDDTFLSELESALGGPHDQELLPFDALTPRVQEISSQVR